MYPTIHNILKQLLPAWARPQAIACSLLDRQLSLAIVSGPFAGMHWDYRAMETLYYPYILGTHELELHGTIGTIIEAAPATILTVGAGHGYFAIGLARRLPQAHVIAFEIDEQRLVFMHRTASQNGVASQISIHHACTPENLRSNLEDAAPRFVMMDVEGAEVALLDPCAAPGLAASLILVELHEFVDHDIPTIIARRFNSTHSITEIWSRPRTLSDLALPVQSLQARLLRRYLVRAMDESRPGPMRWYFLVPR